MPLPPDWIEVRDLCPAAAFWSPAVCAGFFGLAGRLSGWRRRILVVALSLWFLGIFIGSFYIQRRAREEASDPGLRVRWEALEEIVGHPLPR